MALSFLPEAEAGTALFCPAAVRIAGGGAGPIGFTVSSVLDCRQPSSALTSVACLRRGLVPCTSQGFAQFGIIRYPSEGKARCNIKNSSLQPKCCIALLLRSSRWTYCDCCRTRRICWHAGSTSVKCAVGANERGLWSPFLHCIPGRLLNSVESVSPSAKLR